MSRTALAGKPFIRILEGTAPGKINLEVTCTGGCGRKFPLTVPESGLRAWVGGAHIQDCIPLPTDARELLISGTCPECWDRLFEEDHEGMYFCCLTHARRFARWVVSNKANLQLPKNPRRNQ